MTTRPDKLPEWATGAADVVEPSTGRKAIGWLGAERPAAEFFNWILNYIYLWCWYLSDGVISRIDASDDSPLWQFQNRDNETMMYADPNGYFGFGPGIFEQHVWWPITDDVGITLVDERVSDRMDVNSSAGVRTRILGAKSSLAIAGSYGPVLSFDILSSGSGDIASVTYVDNGSANLMLGGDGIDDSVLVYEQRIAMEDASASNEFRCVLGLGEVTGGTDGTNSSFALFEKANGDTNWQCEVGNDTAGTSVDSGVAPVDDIWTTLRVEMHGVNTVVGVDNSFGTARFFIDGVLVAEIADGNFPITSGPHTGFNPHVYVASTAAAPAATVRFQMQTMKVAWQESATPHIPA